MAWEIVDFATVEVGNGDPAQFAITDEDRHRATRAAVRALGNPDPGLPVHEIASAALDSLVPTVERVRRAAYRAGYFAAVKDHQITSEATS